jgi:CRP-like cAMP-binding protein
VNIVAKKGTMDVVLNTLSRGDFFGEMALVDDEPRSARAVVEEEAECAVFTQKEINTSRGISADQVPRQHCDLELFGWQPRS